MAFRAPAWIVGLALVAQTFVATTATAQTPAAHHPGAAQTTASTPLRAKGSQHRTYFLKSAGKDMPYRLYVPTTWDGRRPLPLILFLHGGGSDENRYIDRNDRQLEKLAEQHGYILVAPLGYSPIGGYGSALLLGGSYGEIEGQAKIRAKVNADPAHLRELALSEEDTIAVLDRTLAEYPVDRRRVFLMGHSMGSGGTWYLGNRYAKRWRALAPMSGPFAEQSTNPFANLKGKPIYYTEGVQTPTISQSRLMAADLKKDGYKVTYEEFDADHGGMIAPAAPKVFDFFDAEGSR